MARLRQVPDAPPRAVAYIRVSETREEGISPEIQMAAIEAHCARAGYVLIDTITDLDLTGRFWKRRRVEQAIAMIERHEADVLVVWKISRVARNRLDWAIAVDRVESIGGKLDSATEPMDASTSTGRLARGMLAEFAAFESDRAGDVWKEVHARRHRQGLPHTAWPRFGYVIVDGIHRPDPDLSPILAAMYRRFIAGESANAIAIWLNREGIRTTPSKAISPTGMWRSSQVLDLLDNGFAAGYFKAAGQLHQGAHEPVIDEATWIAYQAARAERRFHNRREASPYLLSGIVFCSCGSAMSGCRGLPDGTKPRYRCRGPAYPAHGGIHTGSTAIMAKVDTAVHEWLQRYVADLQTTTAAKVAARSRATRRRQDAKALSREIVDVDRALTKLAVDQARDQHTPASIWAAARDELLAERRRLEGARLIAQAAAVGEAPEKLARWLVDDWETIPFEQKRAALRKLIARVTVTRDGPRAEPRVECTPAHDL